MSSRTPEGKVKAEIKLVLNRLGIYWFCPRGSALGRSGIPDFICCYKGAFLALEAKAGSNKPSKLQDIEIARIRDAEGFALVVTDKNVGDLEPLLARIGAVMERGKQLLVEDAQSKQLKNDKAAQLIAPERPQLVS